MAKGKLELTWVGKENRPRLEPRVLVDSVAQTVWTWQEVGHTQDGRKEQLTMIPGDPFPTPKPENLIRRGAAAGCGG
jgi:hypothetical protein